MVKWHLLVFYGFLVRPHRTDAPAIKSGPSVYHKVWIGIVVTIGILPVILQLEQICNGVHLCACRQPQRNNQPVIGFLPLRRSCQNTVRSDDLRIEFTRIINQGKGVASFIQIAVFLNVVQGEFHITRGAVKTVKIEKQRIAVTGVQRHLFMNENGDRIGLLVARLWRKKNIGKIVNAFQGIRIGRIM